MQDHLPEKPPQFLQQDELTSFLLPDAIELLEKDFTLSGIEIRFSGKIIGDVFDLRELVAKHVAETGGPGAEPFYRLLYRADIPETKVREALAHPSALSPEQSIAELLIIRALQKAFFRRKYSA